MISNGLLAAISRTLLYQPGGKTPKENGQIELKMDAWNKLINDITS